MKWSNFLLYSLNSEKFFFMASAHYSSQVSQVKSLEKPYSDASSSSFYSMQGAPESKKLEIPNIKVWNG